MEKKLTWNGALVLAAMHLFKDRGPLQFDEWYPCCKIQSIQLKHGPVVVCVQLPENTV